MGGMDGGVPASLHIRTSRCRRCARWTMTRAAKTESHVRMDGVSDVEKLQGPECRRKRGEEAKVHEPASSGRPHRRRSQRAALARGRPPRSAQLRGSRWSMSVTDRAGRSRQRPHGAHQHPGSRNPAVGNPEIMRAGSDQRRPGAGSRSRPRGSRRCRCRPSPGRCRSRRRRTRSCPRPRSPRRDPVAGRVAGDDGHMRGGWVCPERETVDRHVAG